jgi:hypothetical protein
MASVAELEAKVPRDGRDKAGSWGFLEHMTRRKARPGRGTSDLQTQDGDTNEIMKTIIARDLTGLRA